MVLKVITGFLGGAIVGSGVVIVASQLLPPVEIREPAPESSDVAVPAGSGFNAELPDTAPVLPQTEERPGETAASMVEQPGATQSPSLDTRPADTPEAVGVDTEIAAPESSSAPVVASGTEPAVAISGTTAPEQPIVDAAPSALSPVETPTPEDNVQTGLAAPTVETAPVVEESTAEIAPGDDAAELPAQPVADGAPEASGPADTPVADVASAEITAPAGQVDTASLPIPDTPAGPGLAVPKVEDLSPGADDALPRIGAAADTPADVAAEPAIIKHGEAFENSGGNPLLALVLADLPGGAKLGELAEFPIPVTVVVDPTTPGAGARMAELRSMGIEIAVLAPLPEGATPADVEVSFQSFLSAIPQSVAVMDVPEALIQENRPRAAQVVEILKQTGHGLVTYDKGLNAALQISESEDVPAATVFRIFDDGLRNGPAMKRFLDQGAFRAGQVGPVILTGLLRAETLAALAEWSLGNRASTVALAPLSAVLLAQ